MGIISLTHNKIKLKMKLGQVGVDSVTSKNLASDVLASRKSYLVIILPNSHTKCKAKKINILGSRQHPAEKVALWCDFFFFKRGQIAGYSYAYKYVFNGV